MISFFKRNRWALYPLYTFTGCLILGLLILLILGSNLPSLTTLESIDPPVVSKIVSRDGVLLDEIHSGQKRIYVPIERMPDHLIQATIATEDRRFYDHWGIDLRRVIKAAIVNIAAMEIKQGGGTITGQLARDLYLTKKQTYARKIKEALTALQIERTYSKTEILEMYLNQMYYGHRCYGIQSAAKRYFNKNVDDLKIEEGALLIGILQLPAVYSPYNHPDNALRRRNVVLYSMMDFGYLTPAEYDSLKLIPLGVSDSHGSTSKTAPYFCEHVRMQLERTIGQPAFTDGLSIYTSLDTRVQACADSVIQSRLPQIEQEIWNEIKRNRRFTQWLDPPLETEREIRAFLADSARVDSVFRKKATVQVALTAIEPATGQILAMVGGRDFSQSKWNRATQMTRQPGSSFKPIVYTVAIDNGYPPCHELMNTPVVILMLDGSRWSPQNYDGSVGGLTTLRYGLQHSLNLVSVHLVQELIKPQHVVSYAKRFGFTTDIHPYDAIALGADDVIPLELVSAFSVFANRGVRVEPTSILRIEDKNGKLIEEYTPRRREVINENTAYIMTDMLQSVINDGTGARARWMYNFYNPAGGKTGTTNDHADTWFVGFTPQIAAVVWVGFDDQQMSLGEKREGANTALPIWGPFMRTVYDSLKWPLAEFQQPSGVARLDICAETKKIARESCPEKLNEIFLFDLAPTDSCHVHKGPDAIRKRRAASKRHIY